MIFQDAKILLTAAADAEILHWVDDTKQQIAMYHKAGEDEESQPEGWYADDIEELAQSVMKNTHVQNILLSKLHQQGIYPKWFDVKGWKRLCTSMGIECRIEEVDDEQS